jgi:sec-independent protein translocase protein TatA
MGSFSIAHWLVVVVILLLIFGPKRLSEVGKGLGQGIRNFKKGLDGSEKEKAEEDEEEKPAKQLKGSSKKAAPPEDEEEDEEEDAPRPKKSANQKRAEREAD